MISMSANTTTSKPEFFRLPTRGGDPFFGLCRGWYYNAEKRGIIRLVRLRERGKLRGVTLVPFDATAAFIRSQSSALNETATS